MSFSYGADLGWVTQLEKMGYYWSNEMGERQDVLEILSDFGVDSIRLRLFVDPPKDGFWDKSESERCMLGFCDTQSVIEMARRVKAAGMDLMLDLHYSDVFADPAHQHIPHEWEGDSPEELCFDINKYTVSVMEQFKEAGITPRWVQVGNEINPGMLLPVGDAGTNMKVLARFLNEGYDAVKRVFPDTLVITHLASGAEYNWMTKWFDAFFENGGKTDILGFSQYPYWYDTMENAVLTDLGDNMVSYYEKYHKPMMVVEVGELETEPCKTTELLKKTINDLNRVPDNQGVGIFYWEPDVGKDILPDGYPLGAAVLVSDNEIRFTSALSAFRH